MPAELPQIITDYLAADASRDPDALAAIFAPDAHVHDESHDYIGIDAIKAWKRDSAAKYTYTVEPLSQEVWLDGVSLKARLAGSFPGSPVDVVYTFTIDNNQISRLTIE